MTLSRRKFLLRGAAATAALAIGQDAAARQEAVADTATSGPIQAVTDTAALMPRHGTVSIQPARNWDEALAAGNGIMGALLYGDPRHDTLVANHCKLWLPAGSREILPDMGHDLPEMRRIIGETGLRGRAELLLPTGRKQRLGRAPDLDRRVPPRLLPRHRPAAGRRDHGLRPRRGLRDRRSVGAVADAGRATSRAGCSSPSPTT